MQIKTTGKLVVFIMVIVNKGYLISINKFILVSSEKLFIFVKVQKLPFMNEPQEKVILPLRMVIVSL